jgi:hypothetical protein
MRKSLKPLAVLAIATALGGCVESEPLDYSTVDAMLSSQTRYEKYTLIDSDSDGEVDIVHARAGPILMSAGELKVSGRRLHFQTERTIGNRYKTDKIGYYVEGDAIAIPDSLQEKMNLYHSLGQELTEAVDQYVRELEAK